MLLLTATVLANDTEVFATDLQAVRWIAGQRASMRQQLAVVGPAQVQELAPLLEGVDVALHPIPPDQDPEDAAFELRGRLGLPCAVALAPLEEGWAGWVSGHCSLLYLGAWTYEDGQVRDHHGHRVLVPRFAADAGDQEVLRTYKRLDRARGRGIVATMLGTGLLYVGGLGHSDARTSGTPTEGWVAVMAAGGALTLGGVVQFAIVQAKPASMPRRLDAHYTDDEIRERVEAHNRRLRMVWTVGPASTGLVAAF